MATRNKEFKIKNGLSLLNQSGEEKIIVDSAGNVNVPGNLVVSGTTIQQQSVSAEGPSITIGQDNPSNNDSKDRGIIFNWFDDSTFNPTHVIGNGTTTVSVVVPSTEELKVGERVVVTGATGSEQAKLNGSWLISGIQTGTTFSMVVGTAVAAQTLTTTLGTWGFSKEGFFGFDVGPNKEFVFLKSISSNSSGSLLGRLGNFRASSVTIDALNVGGHISTGSLISTRISLGTGLNSDVKLFVVGDSGATYSFLSSRNDGVPILSANNDLSVHLANGTVQVSTTGIVSSQPLVIDGARVLGNVSGAYFSSIVDRDVVFQRNHVEKGRFTGSGLVVSGQVACGNDLRMQFNDLSLSPLSGYGNIEFNYSGKSVPFRFMNGSGSRWAEINSAGLLVDGQIIGRSIGPNSGTPTTGTSSNWVNIGTIYLTDSQTAQIKILGTAGYGAGIACSGETIVNLRGDNLTSGIGATGYFYGNTQGMQVVSAIAIKQTGSGTRLYDIFVLPGGSFSAISCFVDSSSSFWPANVDTGSGSQPSGSTLIESKWNLAINGVSRISVDSLGLNGPIGQTTRHPGAFTALNIRGYRTLYSDGNGVYTHLSEADAGWASAYGVKSNDGSIDLGQFGATGGNNVSASYSYVAAQGQDYSNAVLKVYPNAVGVNGSLSASGGITSRATSGSLKAEASSDNTYHVEWRSNYSDSATAEMYVRNTLRQRVATNGSSKHYDFYGLERVDISSTGLSVTGSLTASGDIEAAGHLNFESGSGYTQINTWKTSGLELVCRAGGPISFYSGTGQYAGSISEAGLALTGNIRNLSSQPLGSVSAGFSTGVQWTSPSGGGIACIARAGVDGTYFYSHTGLAGAESYAYLGQWGVSGLEVATGLSVSGGIESNNHLTARKAGSDSIGAGPYLQLMNPEGTSTWVTQLGASNTLDFWQYNYGWHKRGQWTNSGLSVAGTLTSNSINESAAGNLGISVVPSAWIGGWRAIDIVEGGASLYGSLAIGGLATNAHFNSAQNWVYKTSFGAGRYDQQSDGSHVWYSAPAGAAGAVVPFAQSMVLSSAGLSVTGSISTASDIDAAGSIVSGSARTVPGGDWNNANKTGAFMGYDCLHAPGGGWFIGNVVSHNSGYVTQELWDFTNPGIPRFRRYCLNGVWGSWINIGGFTSTGNFFLGDASWDDDGFDGTKGIKISNDNPSLVLNKTGAGGKTWLTYVDWQGRYCLYDSSNNVEAFSFASGSAFIINNNLNVVNSLNVGQTLVVGNSIYTPTLIISGVHNVAAGVASSGISLQGAGIAHSNIAWLPNERTFRFGTSNDPTGTGDVYGNPSIQTAGSFRANTSAINNGKFETHAQDGFNCFVGKTSNDNYSLFQGFGSGGNLAFQVLGTGQINAYNIFHSTGNIYGSSGRAVLRDNSLENQYNAADGNISINYGGYQGLNGYWRDLDIWDGKYNPVAKFIGLEKGLLLGDIGGYGLTGRRFRIVGGHVTSTMQLYSLGDGGANTASLDFWASEPGQSYCGSGIGSNVNNHIMYGPRNSSLYAQYLRFQADGNISLGIFRPGMSNFDDVLLMSKFGVLLASRGVSVGSGYGIALDDGIRSWSIAPNSGNLFISSGDGGGATYFNNVTVHQKGVDIQGDSTPGGVGLGFGSYPSGGYDWIQSFGGRTLKINPLGNAIEFGGNVYTSYLSASTAAPGTNTTQVATTAFVKTAIDNIPSVVSQSTDRDETNFPVGTYVMVANAAGDSRNAVRTIYFSVGYPYLYNISGDYSLVGTWRHRGGGLFQRVS